MKSGSLISTLSSLNAHLQDIDIYDIQRIFRASKDAPVFNSQAYSPVPDRAVFQLDRSVSSWQHPKQEESAERKPLFDAGLTLIAEVADRPLDLLSNYVQSARVLETYKLDYERL